MPASKTALVLANRGDPIFGALFKVALRGARGIFRTVRSVIKSRGAAPSGELVRSPATGALVRIAKSKAARVVAEGTAFGGIAAVAGRAVRSTLGPPGSNVQDGFVVGPGGCPTGKLVNVAAHQRVIPLDRFGRPRRRIDVLNTKALARATRRLGGFQKRARRVEKQLARIAPRSRSRKRSKGVC